MWLRFVFFGGKEIGAKAARKMLMKLTAGYFKSTFDATLRYKVIVSFLIKTILNRKYLLFLNLSLDLSILFFL